MASEDYTLEAWFGENDKRGQFMKDEVADEDTATTKVTHTVRNERFCGSVPIPRVGTSCKRGLKSAGQRERVHVMQTLGGGSKKRKRKH